MNSGEECGLFYFKGSHVYDFKFKGISGERGLEELLYFEGQGCSFKFIEEPQHFNLFDVKSVIHLKKFLEKGGRVLSLLNSISDKIPPRNTKLLSQKKTLLEGNDEEKLILEQLSSAKSVDELINSCNLSEFEIILNLIGLRQKNLLIVKRELDL